MTTTQEIFALAQAALEFDLARRVAASIAAQRGAIYCERAESDLADFPRQPKPCWKTFEDTGQDIERLDDELWCANCRRRQQIHRAYQKAARTRGARMRVLHRFALRGIDPRSIEREVRRLMGEHEGATEHTPATEETQSIPHPDGDSRPLNDPGDENDAKTEETATE